MVTAKDWLWHPCPVGNNAVNLYILIESVNFFKTWLSTFNLYPGILKILLVNLY